MLPTNVPDLVSRARDNDQRSIARLLSLVENSSQGVVAVMRALGPGAAASRVVGLTGAPGVGKSTTTSALVSGYRAEGLRVAVLAVDPTSPFTGGALLGDRVRMQEHAGDEGVFIRSLATRGRLGGLSWRTPQAIRVLEGIGFDVVLVETVGVGQSEVEIAATADTTVVLLAPGMGDGIQAAKAGVLEIGDVFAVNKADRDGADVVARDVKGMLRLDPRQAGQWRHRVVLTVASTGEGMVELLEAIEAHQRWLTEHGERDRRRLVRARDEIESAALDLTVARMRQGEDGQALARLSADVAEGRTDARSAAESLLGGAAVQG